MAYCDIADVRAEGFLDPPYTDARVQRAIDIACELIDRTTCRWFEPRDLTFDVKWRGSPDLLLPHPVIRIDSVLFLNTDGTTQQALDVNDYLVFNRHVRTGQTNERDDREDPKLSFQFLRPDTVTPRPRQPTLVQELLGRREQNVRVVGKWGYTDPDYTAARTPTADAGDAITAPDTIKLTNGGFTSEDVGKTITIAGSASNDGTRTIASVPAADTVKTVEQDLTTEGSGFTATLSAFPQFGVTPNLIKDVCLKLVARYLPTGAAQSSGTGSINPNRITRMATRDQSISFMTDPRLTAAGGAGGDGTITGDPEIDRILTMFRCPPRMGAV